MKVHITITDDDGKTHDGTLNFEKTIKNPKISIKNKPEVLSNNEISINIPENLIESLMKLDERQLIPILWSFSSNPIMNIEGFIQSCGEKGFLLNSSWLPSVGGNFKNRIVKEDRMLTDAKTTINGKKAWKLTDVGKIKLNKILSELSKK
ncbi:MAG: hypothetical protein RI100_00565 [Nitrosarchaeum sp.]|jgi:hypothetical protein|uniref:hypothetical protein n=1 Tax=Nitrosarchaeum sp. TaxID=2026886 RepID=UPI002DE94F7A|nr:hypothetical protein [Nitrosarchaeum sp.]